MILNYCFYTSQKKQSALLTQVAGTEQTKKEIKFFPALLIYTWHTKFCKFKE